VKEAKRSAEIPRPASEVFSFLADLENLPRWQSGVIRAELTSPGTIGVGSTAVVERRMFGQQIVADLVVSAYEPPRRIVLETEASGVSIQASVEIEPLGPDSCRVTFGMAMETTGFFMKAVEPMVAQAAETDIEASLARLGEVLA
jgi:carbon monoxide dehydrogenase subunit G